MSQTKTKIISFRIPEGDLAEVDALVQKKVGGRDRTDFLRSAVVQYIGKLKQDGKQ